MKSFIAALTLLGSIAQADVLFLDVNNNPKEIESARQAAAARKEKLIVYPPSTGGKKSAQNPTDLTESGLAQKLAELSKSKTKISAIIISGHDGNGHFSGSRGSISAASVREGLQANPALAAGVRAFYLWGCYTATYGSCEAHWKKDMPNLGIVVGFEGSAPAQDKVGNHTYLMDAMKYEKQLTSARDDKTLRKVFGKIRNINQVSASMCMNDRVINNVSVRNLEGLGAICEKILREKAPQRWSERISCYRNGEKGCENVPDDTANGELRRIYNELQEASHCSQVFEESENEDVQALAQCWPNADQLIRLVLNRQVMKNFQKNHAKDVDNYDRALAALGLGDHKLGDTTLLSRTELNSKLAAAQAAVAKRLDDLAIYRTKDAEKVAELEIRNKTLSTTLNILDGYCVPFNWVEPIQTQPSKCVAEPESTHLAQNLTGAFAKKVVEEAPEVRALEAQDVELRRERQSIDNTIAGAYGENRARMERRLDEIENSSEGSRKRIAIQKRKDIEAELDRIRDANPDHASLLLYQTYRGPNADPDETDKYDDPFDDAHDRAAFERRFNRVERSRGR